MQIQIKILLEQFAGVGIGLKGDYSATLPTQSRHQDGVLATMSAYVDGAVPFRQTLTEQLNLQRVVARNDIRRIDVVRSDRPRSWFIP
jgi:hypothetical protein